MLKTREPQRWLLAVGSFGSALYLWEGGYWGGSRNYQARISLQCCLANVAQRQCLKEGSAWKPQPTLGCHPRQFACFAKPGKSGPAVRNQLATQSYLNKKLLQYNIESPLVLVGFPLQALQCTGEFQQNRHCWRSKKGKVKGPYNLLTHIWPGLWRTGCEFSQLWESAQKSHASTDATRSNCPSSFKRGPKWRSQVKDRKPSSLLEMGHTIEASNPMNCWCSAGIRNGMTPFSTHPTGGFL